MRRWISCAVGVELSDGLTRPAVVKRVRDSGKYSHIEIQITEGRNRQVRRMIEAVGSKVLKLVRTGIGPIEIAGLKIGTWRSLSEGEIKACAGMSPGAAGTSARATRVRLSGPGRGRR